MSHLNKARKQMFFDKKAYSSHRHNVVTGWLLVIVASLLGFVAFVTWLFKSDELSMIEIIGCGVGMIWGLTLILKFTHQMNAQRAMREMIKTLVDKLEDHHRRFSADDETYVFFDGMIKTSLRDNGAWSVISTTEDGLPVLSFDARYYQLTDGSVADGILHYDGVTVDVVRSIVKAIDAYENLADASEEAARMRTFMQSEKASLAKLVER